MPAAREERFGAPPKIWIVEDDPAVRRSLLLLLQGRGFEARAFPAGGPMLSDAEVGSADCAVIDYRLDDRDGIDLLRRLREQGWTRPAILISAHNADDLAARALKTGFAMVLEKPLREHVLVDAVARLTRADAGAASVSR